MSLELLNPEHQELALTYLEKVQLKPQGAHLAQ